MSYYLKNLKRNFRKMGIFEIISEEYEALDPDDRIDFDEFCIQIHINHCMEKGITWNTMRKHFPKEYLWVLQRFRYNKIHTALIEVLEHNSKIDSIRKKIGWKSLSDYSHEIMPLKGFKE